MFKELYKYRELLKTNVKKEIRGKYKGSFLGVLWSFMNPLLMTLVYAIVFPYLLRNTEPHYVTYIVTGILPWTWFTTSIALGTTIVIVSHSLGSVKKLCKRGIWVSDGKVQLDGKIDKVIDEYIKVCG